MQDEEMENEGGRHYWKLPFLILGLAVLILILGTILVRLPSSGQMSAMLKASWAIY